MHTDKDYSDRFAQEIIDLHCFFEDWFTGRCENSVRVFEERLKSRMHDDLMLVLPAGLLVGADDFWPDLYRGHGNNPDFGISIKNVNVCECSREPVFIVTYEEWQRNAANSTPPNNGRISTATLVHDDNAPNQLRWLHIHETWLPEDIVSQASFDW